jgi:hypothetical protein
VEPAPLRVFLSHTSELASKPTGGTFVAAAASAVTRAGQVVTDMEYFAVRDQSAADVSVAEVARADIFVGVLGLRYGSLVPDRPAISYTELEFDTATELGLPRLMFLLDESANLPLDMALDREHGARQDAFRARVLDAGLVAGKFATPEGLTTLVYQALVEHFQQAPSTSPAPPGWRRRSLYAGPVHDIFPGDLISREPELAELTLWCRGPDAYAWWQGPAWAGKTALAATFAQHPPLGVVVVAFFVTARLPAQSNVHAFTDTVLEQLAALTGRRVPPSLTAAERFGLLSDWLADAARTQHEQGHVLALLVDGLDEDSGGGPGSGVSSIASRLPQVVPPGLKILVTGRPSRPLPSDLPADHPLTTVAPRMLSISPYAAVAGRTAERELADLIAGDPQLKDVIGLITAAGGGLSRDDLGELTGVWSTEMQSLLAGPAGHSVGSRTEGDRTVYLLAHETLRELAAQQIGPAIGTYRDRIDDWVARYRTAGWPAATPRYTLTGYFRAVADRSELARLVELATDPRRHDRLLEIFGGDAAALAEVGEAQRLLLAADRPDLAALARLNVRREALSDRNVFIPVELPAVWDRIGNRARAEALVYSLTDFHHQVDAFAALARLATRAGARDHARTWAEAVESAARAEEAFHRAYGLAVAAAIRLGIDDNEAARRLIEDATAAGRIAGEEIWRPDMTAYVATALADGGAPEAAQALLDAPEPDTSRVEPLRRAEARAAVAVATARLGDLDGAEALVRRMDAVAQRAAALADTAKIAARHGDPDRARRLVDEAIAQARAFEPWVAIRATTAEAVVAAWAHDGSRASALLGGIPDEFSRASAAAAVSDALDCAGRHDAALRLVRGIARARTRAAALTTLARNAAERADPEGAAALIAEVEKAVRGIFDGASDPPYISLAMAHAQAGEPTRVRALLDAAPFAEQVSGWASMALLRSRSGDQSGAEQALRTAKEVAASLIAPDAQLAGFLTLAWAAGRLVRAEARSYLDRAFTVAERRGLPIDASTND